MSIVAYHSETPPYPPDFFLNGFADEQPIAKLHLPVGKFVVLGKVVVTNLDSGDQNVRIRMLAEQQDITLDQSDSRIQGGGDQDHPAQSFSLQAVLDVPGKIDFEIVSLLCSTSNGNVEISGASQHPDSPPMSVLIAIKVDQLNALFPQPGLER